MAKKRGHNEGSIHKRKNGTWRVQVTVNGQRLSFSSKSRTECRAWMKQTLEQVEQGLSFESAKLTYAKFLQEWLISVENTLRSSTFVQYESHVRMYIVPTLGKFKMKDLKPEHIQRRYNEMVKEGYGLRTVQVTHAVIHRSLVYAVKLGLIPRNPDDATNPPRPKAKEMQHFDENQAQLFLLVAKAKQDRHYALYHLAISTGMRQGELIGLKWADLDWQTCTLQVQRQWTRKKGGGFEFTSPKTKAGKRSIMLGSSDLAVLREHKQVQYLAMQKAGERWKDMDMLFASTVGTPLCKYNLRKSFKQRLKDAGLPNIRFHDLRHTAASLMLNNGIPVIVVSRRLGHARPSITLDVYGHLIPSKQREVAELMDELLTPISIDLSP